ncbi:MAG: AAA family ATPase [Gammaproteobacteria bacterium]|nr:AAA family ATPase [Gammaproteobacteria bacterium]
MKPAENRRFAHGLVVGKFSPLHKGHEFMISRAQAECDTLFLISYSEPELPGCERARRESWLKSRFPQLPVLVLDQKELRRLATARGIASPPPIPHNDASDIEQRLFCGWLCRNLLGTRVDAVFTSEDYGDGFAAVLTDYFRRDTPDAPDVVHRCIDRDRVHVPISGSRLRADPHGLRQFLAPEVYADFMERVLLLGGESTGKTTLAAALAQTLDTQWVPEYGRELWEHKNGAMEFTDMLHIAQTQIAREEALAMNAQRWLICDSSPFTSLLYSHVLFDRADPQLERLANRHYDHVFLCATDFEFVQDGTRRDAVFRQYQQDWYERELARRGMSYRLVGGSVEERVETILGHLNRQT